MPPVLQLLFDTLKKKKVPHQIFTIDEQWDSLNKQYINTVATQPLFIQLIDIEAYPPGPR